jgi:hypothetical protein
VINRNIEYYCDHIVVTYFYSNLLDFIGYKCRLLVTNIRITVNIYQRWLTLIDTCHQPTILKA